MSFLKQQQLAGRIPLLVFQITNNLFVISQISREERGVWQNSQGMAEIPGLVGASGTIAGWSLVDTICLYGNWIKRLSTSFICNFG